MKRPRAIAMRSSRAQRFPGTVRSTLLEWDTYLDHATKQIHATVKTPGSKTPAEFVLSPDEAYEFTRDIMRRFDEAVGI